MSQQTVNIGTNPNDGTGDPLRTAFTKANQNFTELYKGSRRTPNVGRLFTPDGANPGGIGAGATLAANTIKLFAGFIPNTMTIDQLFFRVTTNNASNISAAIYAADATTNLPTGTALVSTGSISIAAGSSVTASISKQLTSDLYWFATNSDASAGALVTTGPNVVGAINTFVGGASGFDVLEATAGIAGYTIAQTFGTWPDLTGQSFTMTHSGVPIFALRTGSIP